MARHLQLDIYSEFALKANRMNRAISSAGVDANIFTVVGVNVPLHKKHKITQIRL